MEMTVRYAESEPTRAAVDSMEGLVLLEFGAPWCPHCLGAQPLIAAALTGFSGIQHLKIEDGQGRPLGRSYRVKLWPTLIFLNNGQEVTRLVRPRSHTEIRDALTQLQAAAAA